MTDPIMHFPCNTVEEFIDTITPNDEEEKHQWVVYRGQADADWGLVPSAFRESSLISARSLFGCVRATPKEQAHFEALTLQRFLKACDLSGLPVPGYTRGLAEELERILEQKMDYNWPNPMFDEPLAVAQHYGVPTRLLDWTRRPFVAAYFAASSALQLKRQPKHIAVWAMDITRKNEWAGVSIVSLPGGTAANLAAQSGLFTIQRGIKALDFASPELEKDPEIISSAAAKNHHIFAKITLPFAQCEKLLRRCARFGVSAPVLFPGMEGAKKYVDDWAYSEFYGDLV